MTLLASTLLPLMLPMAAQGAPMPTLEQSRLQTCMNQVRTDTTGAIAAASAWQGEVMNTAGEAYPLQCLGIAYTRMGHWEAAADAFTRARSLAPETQIALRARLGAMAGNAALAAGNDAAASAILAPSETEARSAGDTRLAAGIAYDLARALDRLGDAPGATEAITRARTQDPQSAEAWQMSAVLARQAGDLAQAQYFIETASKLAPKNLDVGLEAGIIAAKLGYNDAARKSFSSVLAVNPTGPYAEVAQAYLAQLPAAQ
jgi:tetratricopeptide (TPR) repeat protein